MMHALRFVGIVGLVLAAGCAGVKQPPSAMAQSGPLLVDPSLVGRNQDAAEAAEAPRPEAPREAIVLAPPPAAPPQAVTSAGEASASAAVTPAPAPPSTKLSAAEDAAPPAPVTSANVAPAPPVRSASAAKAAAPPAKAPATASAPPPAIEKPRKNDAPAPVAKAGEPPLDVSALKERLRETNAIGVFTKLALKNQVDDLLQQFRAHYLSGQKTSVPALRQAYDMLVLKVLALIQDSDPALARSISGSREAIWGILADPVKFNAAS